MEKIKKRVHELQTGDVFWFSGVWRTVRAIDEKYLHYATQYIIDGDIHWSNADTIMKNSQMLVEIKN